MNEINRLVTKIKEFEKTPITYGHILRSIAALGIAGGLLNVVDQINKSQFVEDFRRPPTVYYFSPIADEVAQNLNTANARDIRNQDLTPCTITTGKDPYTVTISPPGNTYELLPDYLPNQQLWSLVRLASLVDAPVSTLAACRPSFEPQWPGDNPANVYDTVGSPVYTTAGNHYIPRSGQGHPNMLELVGNKVISVVR